MKHYFFSGCIMLAGLFPAIAVPADQTGGATPERKTAPYIWNNIQIVGGGFVDGIIFHPSEPGLRYARTDMGGAYRWHREKDRWQPLTDWISYEDRNLMGIESIAVDPSNPDRVYIACGTYTDNTNNAILRSDDRGRTFDRVNVPMRFGGNENGRGNGERMAVDPNDGNIIYIGTRKQGLWRSTDRGERWEPVESFPDVTPNTDTDAPGWRNPNVGVVFVQFDPASGGGGEPSSTLYAGVSLMERDNLFRSTDGGKTWEPVPGHPRQYRPNHADVAADGKLYITYGDRPGPYRMVIGGVWRFDMRTGEWAEITPEHPTKDKPFGYASVSVDAGDPKTLIVSSFHRPGGEEIFRSTDAGKTWTGIFADGGQLTHERAPYTAFTPIHWLFDVEINPTDPDHAIFTTGYGGYETFNLTAADKGKPTAWRVMSQGIEETVPLDLLSPPKGAHLVTAIGDYGGFVHRDLDKPAPEGNFLNPHFGNTDSVATAWRKPQIIVRVGIASGYDVERNIGYSLDYGKSWLPANQPKDDSRHGHIAVSADGGSWIWTPRTGRDSKNAAWLSTDKGHSWTQCKGLPPNTRVTADRVNPQKFYAMDLFGGRFFVSTDGGGTFEPKPLDLSDGEVTGDPGERGDVRGGQDRLYTTPGREGDLWLAAYHGLYHSADSGRSFQRMDHVSEMHGFGFGKAAPGSDYPALYMVGVVDGLHAIYRSDDKAQRWVRINDDDHQWGLILHVTGDPKQYGRVYVGTHGRGALYGDPVRAE